MIPLFYFEYARLSFIISLYIQWDSFMAAVVFSFKIDITDEGYKRSFQHIQTQLRSLYGARYKPISNKDANIEGFKKEVAETMVRIATEAVQELILITPGTTGNLASGWHVSFNKSDRSEKGVYDGDFNDWENDTWTARDMRTDAIYLHNQAIAQQREQSVGKTLQQKVKTSYTIYIINSAFMSPGLTQGETFFKYGYYASEGLGWGWFKNKSAGISIDSETDAGDFLAEYFKEHFTPEMKRLRRKYKLGRG